MKPQNIIIILADQFRKDCIGAYGNQLIKTPNIDRLAAQSIRFNRSYTANPICSPSRMTWFSGMYPSNHGLYTNGLVKDDDGRTIMHDLAGKGYQTANIGKIHLSPYSAESEGRSFESVNTWDQIPKEDGYTGGYFGYDYVELTIGHTLPKAHYYKWFQEHGGTDDMFRIDSYIGSDGTKDFCGIRNMPSRLSSSSFVGERSVNYLKQIRNPEKPFFLTVSFPDPHHPFAACYDDYQNWKDRETAPPIGTAEDLKQRPAHFRQQFDGGWSRAGATDCMHKGGLPEDIARERIIHTYAMIEAIDRNIGLVLDELERQNLMDSTIIVLGSDHGELLGDHGLWTKGPFLYEGLINTPLLMHVPGVEAGVSDKLVSSVDIMPTLMDLLGYETPAYADGYSQVPHIMDGSVTVRDCCLVEYRNGYDCDVNVNAIVGDTYKYIAYETGEQEYTDLKHDPKEQRNLAEDARYAKQVSSASKALLLERLKAKSKGAIQYGHA